MMGNAVWTDLVSALRWVPLSAYAAYDKPAFYSKGHAVCNWSGDCTEGFGDLGIWGFYTDPVSPVTLFDFFTGNLADW
jgi:hypothetical protein